MNTAFKTLIEQKVKEKLADNELYNKTLDLLSKYESLYNTAYGYIVYDDDDDYRGFKPYSEPTKYYYSDEIFKNLESSLTEKQEKYSSLSKEYMEQCKVRDELLTEKFLFGKKKRMLKMAEKRVEDLFNERYNLDKEIVSAKTRLDAKRAFDAFEKENNIDLMLDRNFVAACEHGAISAVILENKGLPEIEDVFVDAIKNEGVLPEQFKEEDGLAAKAYKFIFDETRKMIRESYRDKINEVTNHISNTNEVERVD